MTGLEAIGAVVWTVFVYGYLMNKPAKRGRGFRVLKDARFPSPPRLQAKQINPKKAALDYQAFMACQRMYNKKLRP